METLDFLSSKTWSWCKANNIELKGGEHAKVGDIVICSYKGEDFENPGDLDTVLKVCKKQKLVAKKGKNIPMGLSDTYSCSLTRSKKKDQEI